MQKTAQGHFYKKLECVVSIAFQTADTQERKILGVIIRHKKGRYKVISFISAFELCEKD
jgi:hypothetical protein